MTGVVTAGALSYVVVENWPEESPYWDDKPGEREGVARLTPEYRELPQRLIDALLGLLADFDNRACAGFGCENAVGGILEDDDDNRARSGSFWRSCTVVDDGHRSWVLCEDCTGVLLPVEPEQPPNLTLIPLPGGNS